MERLGAGKVVVKGLQGVKEALHLIGPRQRLGIAPRLTPLGHRKRPIKQVSDVRKNLNRGSHVGASLEINVALRRVANCLSATVGNRCHGVTKQFASADRLGRHFRINLAGRQEARKRSYRNAATPDRYHRRSKEGSRSADGARTPGGLKRYSAPA